MQTDYYKNIPGDMFDFKEFYFKIANELPHNAVIAEVGVADGKSALYLAGALKALGKSFTLYMIDSLDYGGKDQLNTIINHVIKAGIEGIEIFPFDSLTAANRFPEVHFDFVFIDSSHEYLSTKEEIREWYKRIKEDGILAGHDYNEKEGIGVKMAVDETIPQSIARGKIHIPEQVLNVEPTSLAYGVWWVKKKWYAGLYESN